MFGCGEPSSCTACPATVLDQRSAVRQNAPETINLDGFHRRLIRNANHSAGSSQRGQPHSVRLSNCSRIERWLAWPSMRLAGAPSDRVQMLASHGGELVLNLDFGEAAARRSFCFRSRHPAHAVGYSGHAISDTSRLCADQRGDDLPVPDRLGRVEAVLEGVPVALRRTAAGAVHPADGLTPHRRRPARLPAPLRSGSASRCPEHGQDGFGAWG